MVTATQPAHKKERGPHLGKGADQGLSRFLDAEKRSTRACRFEHAMREKIVGQDEAVEALVDLYQVFCAGLHSPGRPEGNLLFLGPTGSGKTRTVEAAAEILFGDSRAVIKVDCAEFQHDDMLGIELRQVQKRVLDPTTRPFMFRITSEGREFLLEEGTDQRYGARQLQRAIERNVVCPLSRLLATEQLHQGDVLLIDRHRGDEGLVFLRDTEKRSSVSKIDFPIQGSGQLMTVEARV